MTIENSEEHNGSRIKGSENVDNGQLSLTQIRRQYLRGEIPWEAYHEAEQKLMWPRYEPDLATRQTLEEARNALPEDEFGEREPPTNSSNR